MSYVIAAPEMLAAAATDVEGIGTALSEAHSVVAGPTLGLVPAAADEVSALITQLFSGHAQEFQALSAKAAAFHEQFVQALNTSVGSYASAEAQAANALTGIFGSAPITPVPATPNPTFTGTPSLASRIETAALYPVKELLTVTGVYNQLGTPGSPALQLLANTSNIPGLSLILGNSPPKFLPLLLGETVQQIGYDGMPVVQITPAHPDGNYVVGIHGGAFVLPPTLFHWIDYSMMAYQTGATIEVPIYPLMQQGGTAGVVVPEMAGLISSEIVAHGLPT